jgi:hypothetical protein
MLHDIHTAITQAGADFQWTDYDRYPELQTHTLLGVRESTVALQQAGGWRTAHKNSASGGQVRAAGLQREDVTEAQ